MFGDKALNGPAIEQLHFIGDINANGIDNTILGEEQDEVTTITYLQADNIYCCTDWRKGTGRHRSQNVA